MAEIKDYFEYANEAQKILQQARKLELNRGENPPQKKSIKGGKIITFAPHPDDEIMTGLVALRLMLEKGWEVMDVAVSLGSNLERRNGRINELTNACNYLGWKLQICGFDKVRLTTKLDNPKYWAECVKQLAQIIKDEKPNAIMAPHKNDANSAHMATSQLVADALQLLENDFNGFLIETEVWSGMEKPNLLVEAGASELGYLMTALSRHIKEVERNDYHARMPYTFAENVRRGAEIVGGQGGEAPNFDFGVIYNLKKFDGKNWKAFGSSKFASLSDDIENIFK